MNCTRNLRDKTPKDKKNWLKRQNAAIIAGNTASVLNSQLQRTTDNFKQKSRLMCCHFQQNQGHRIFLVRHERLHS